MTINKDTSRICLVFSYSWRNVFLEIPFLGNNKHFTVHPYKNVFGKANECHYKVLNYRKQKLRTSKAKHELINSCEIPRLATIV